MSEIKLFGLTFQEFQAVSLEEYRAATAAAALEGACSMISKREADLSQEEKDLLIARYTAAMPLVANVITDEYLDIQKSLLDTAERFALAVKVDSMREVVASHIGKVLGEASNEWAQEVSALRRKKYLLSLDD